MKKRIACPECNGNGRITLARMYNDYCGIGCKQCDHCGGKGFLEVPMTNAERIRAMSDEELTDAIYRLIHANDPAIWFCKETKECWELMDNDEEIPEEMCRKCLLEKLQQPAEEG